MMRPGVVWFGEPVPHDQWCAAERACSTCDAMLVVGTSAMVHPAAGLIDLARSRGARIITVNTERSDAGSRAHVELIGCAGRLVPRLLQSVVDR